MNYRAGRLLIYFYLLAWLVDLQFVGGSSAQAPLRWAAIALTYLSTFLYIRLTTIFSPRALVFLALIILLTLPTVLLSNKPQYSVIEFLRYGSTFSLFAVCIRTQRSGELLDIFGATLRLVIVSSLVVILVSPMTIELFAASTDIRERTAGTTFSPNFLGFIAALYLGYSLLAKANLPKKLASALVEWIWRGTGVLCVLASGSRTGMLITVFVVSFYFLRKVIVYSGRLAKARPHTLALLLYSIIVVTSALPLFISLQYRLPDVEPTNSFRAADYGRFVAWHNSLETFLSLPFVGSGFASQVTETYDPISERYRLVQYSHNALLNAMQSGGLLGLLTLLLLLWKVVQLIVVAQGILYERSLRICTKMSDPQRNEILFFICAAASTIIDSVAEAGFQGAYGINALFAIALAGLYRWTRLVSGSWNVFNSN